jgi:hypothetical protein
MSLFFADLVREQCFAAGTGDLALGGALPGHRRFADAVPPGVRFHYCVAGVTYPGEWETGEGEIGSGNSLIRIPYASSAGGGAVDFSAGLKTVALTVGARWFAAQDEPAAIDDVAGLELALDEKADLDGAEFTGALSAPSLSLAAALAVADGGTGAATAAQARANLGLAIGADVQAQDSTLAALAGLDGGAGLVEQTGPDAFAKRAIGVTSGASLPTRADADARYQAIDAELGAIAALASAADRLPYFTGAGTAALATFGAFGRSLVDDADAAAGRATLGLGSMAVQSAGGIAVTGGTISGVSTLSCTGNAVLGDATSDAQTLNGAVTINVANGRIIAEGSSGAYLQIRPNSGQAGRLIFTENAVADRWTIGTQAGDGNLYLSTGSSLAAPKLTLNASGVSVTGTADVSGEIRVAQTKVVGARIAGWGVPSGTATRTTFDSGSVTHAQLAERVKALIDDLRSHGLIGS